MTSRKIALQAIKHNQPDRTPLNMTICEKPYLDLLDYFGIKAANISEPDKWGEILMIPELAEALGLDFLFVKAGKPKKKNNNSSIEISTDDWGIVRKKIHLRNGGYYWEIVEHPLKSASLDDLRHYPWPDPENEDIYKNLASTSRNLYENTDYCLIGRFSSSIFETAWFMRGLDQFLIDLVVNQDFAKELMQKIFDIQIKTAESCLELAGKYINILRMGGDLGTQSGTLISPAIFEKMIKPVICKTWNKLKSKFREYNPDGYIMYHSCGNIFSFIPDFIECGLDILDPVQKLKGMEIEKLKDRFGNKLTFHGAIDTQHLLPCCSPTEVKRQVKRIIKVLGKNGGYIAAPVHNIQPDVPIENIIAISEAVRES